jgi:hypothetical protein
MCAKFMAGSSESCSKIVVSTACTKTTDQRTIKQHPELQELYAVIFYRICKSLFLHGYFEGMAFCVDTMARRNYPDALSQFQRTRAARARQNWL